MVVEKRIGPDDERTGLQLDEGGQTGLDLAFGPGLQDIELQPLRASGFLHIFNHGLGNNRIVRVHQQGDYAGLRNQLGQQIEPFGHQLGQHDADPGEVATRPGETGDQPALDRVTG